MNTKLIDTKTLTPETLLELMKLGVKVKDNSTNNYYFYINGNISSVYFNNYQNSPYKLKHILPILIKEINKKKFNLDIYEYILNDIRSVLND